MSPSPATQAQELPRRIGHYTLLRVLGRGGMGIVYAARDERLGRDVAIKMIAELGDDTAIRRFWREARSAAAVSHPNVCQIFEVNETGEGLMLAMELLDGESLETRLGRGALAPSEAVTVSLETLAALGALHARGLVHRDVKPSNVFLTPHGAKLVDFGLTRGEIGDTLRIEDNASQAVTQPGMIIGTPRYMAPEQIRGGPIDARADLYALGAVLFESLAGRPPFVGNNVVDLLYQAMHEKPPALEGPPAVVAIDRVIRRALAKDAAERYASAADMAQDLRGVMVGDISQSSVPIRALMRTMVMPFRLQRADPEIEFLSFGLAEAISSSLAALQGVVVRSTALGAGFASDSPDLRQMAVEADVDVAFLGSLLRSGDQIRASLQLVETVSRTVADATTVQGSVSDVFALEDRLANAAVSMLESRRGVAPPSRRATRDGSPNGKAFATYLRGLELMRRYETTEEARELLEEAVSEDPTLAPAWAILGRACHILAKFKSGREELRSQADDAFRRALALEPESPLAHRYLTNFETDHGHADSAIGRLLQQIRMRRNDAHLFAGLVAACRYGGLLEASVAAHHEARRLDPNIATGVEYTYVQLQDADGVMSLASEAGRGAAPIVFSVGLAMTGRSAEAIAIVDAHDSDRLPERLRLGSAVARAFARRDVELLRELVPKALQSLRDPEAHFLFGLGRALLGDVEPGFELMEGAVRTGFAASHLLETHPGLAALQNRPEMERMRDVASRLRRSAAAVFARGGGGELLGLGTNQASA